MTVAWKSLAITLAATAAMVLPIVVSPSPRLVWNASASVPIGLYRVQPDSRLKVADTVIVRPPEALAWFLAEGGYLPRGVPLLKRVEAVGGQRVCRTSLVISVDGTPVGSAMERDRRGRPLPVWQGCTVLRADQVFLLNPTRPDSLDGRYFGPLSRSAIVGRAEPIWTRRGG